MEILKKINIVKLQAEIKSVYPEILSISCKQKTAENEETGVMTLCPEFIYTFHGIEDENTLESIVNNHNSIDVVNEVINSFLKKEKDGKHFYNIFRSKLYINYTEGIASIEDTVNLELYMKDVSDNLNTGNWITASTLLQEKALIGLFSQELKNELLSGTNEYISNNY